MRKLIAIGVLAVGACVSSGLHQPTTTPAATAESDMICRDVTPTGSLISRHECESRSDAQFERDDAMRWLEKPRPTREPGMGTEGYGHH